MAGLDNDEFILIFADMARRTEALRPLLWIASSKRDYAAFPLRLQENFGFELFLVQTGQHPPSAKPLQGFGGGVVELIGNLQGDTYRAVYTVRYAGAVYVLHAFKKKSKQGIKTPQGDINLIQQRLKDAARDYAERFKPEKKS